MKPLYFVLIAFMVATISLGIAPLKSLQTSARNLQNQQSQNPLPNQEPQTQNNNGNAPSSGDYQPITLPEGATIPIRMSDDVNSNHDKPGTLFTGTVDPSVLINDVVVIPRGTEAH